MRILSRILSRQTEIGGELGYFGLGSWWLATFSSKERRYMEVLFRGREVPASVRPLTKDRGFLGVQTTAGLLILLADKLSNRPEDRPLACRVLAKAEERASSESDQLGLHFTYHQTIRLHLRWREQFRDASDLVFAACHKQMRLSPQAAEAFRRKYPGEPLPIHLGYLNVASVLEQQGALARAIEICKQAQAEGWNGNWPWRIQRMARQLSEQPAAVRIVSRSGIGPV
jgi:hypothetical protein